MFKVGDRVKVECDYLMRNGQIGTVTDILTDDYVLVSFNNRTACSYKVFNLRAIVTEDDTMAQQFKIGDRVQDAVYGIGTIDKFMFNTDGKRYFVRFDNANANLAKKDNIGENRYAWRTAEQLTPVIEETFNAGDIVEFKQDLKFSDDDIIKKGSIGKIRYALHNKIQVSVEGRYNPYELDKSFVKKVNCFSDGRDLEKEYEQQVQEEFAEKANCSNGEAKEEYRPKIGDVVSYAGNNKALKKYMKDAASHIGKVVRVINDTYSEVLFDSIPHIATVNNNEIEEVTVTTMPQKPDMVNHPPHYCQEDGLECIEVMQLLFGKKAVIDYCRCNIFKYRFRAEHKNGKEDIEKAKRYEIILNELLGAGFTVKGKA